MSNGAEASAANAHALQRELAWFDQVLHARISLHFGQPCAVRDVRQIAPPSLAADPSLYAEVARGFSLEERLVVLLALAPHLRPQLLDTLFVRNGNLDRGFTEFGGWKGKAHGGFLPTCETAAFLVAGEDLAARLALLPMFEPASDLRRRGILRVEHEAPGEPLLSGALLLESEYLDLFTTGERHKPDFSAGFPAKRITTALGWGDLVVGPEVMDEITTLVAWVRHADELLNGWGLGRALKPGYRSLFFGPPGTGKTLTATLIGQAVGADVYRIDLSMVVSKFIGETEKNLARVFDQAQNRRWILFFDEADALFGKRTQTNSSNDRFANQEVSYLLQRVEDFPGTVILATNLPANLDGAFLRRFESVVYFPLPGPEQRLRLWREAFSPRARLEVNLEDIAARHELSGGLILNVVRQVSLQAVASGDPTIQEPALLRAIRRELEKEGKGL